MKTLQSFFVAQSSSVPQAEVMQTPPRNNEFQIIPSTQQQTSNSTTNNIAYSALLMPLAQHGLDESRSQFHGPCGNYQQRQPESFGYSQGIPTDYRPTGSEIVDLLKALSDKHKYSGSNDDFIQKHCLFINRYNFVRLPESQLEEAFEIMLQDKALAFYIDIFLFGLGPDQRCLA